MKNPEKLPNAFDIFPFTNLTRWQKFKLWMFADVPYFFDKVYYKLTGKWLLK